VSPTHGSFISELGLLALEMISLIWIAGALGYYSSLVAWIVAQRTRHLHGKYSHSWAMGVLLLTFGILQIIGSTSILIAISGLIALIMPLIVTLTDVKDHRRSGRGLFQHDSHCWMKETPYDNR
jgi:hypothetical protein